MSQKNYVRVDGRLLQTDKKYSQLKLNIWIRLWTAFMKGLKRQEDEYKGGVL